MALVLNTGADKTLLDSRRLIFEHSGHTVVTASNELDLIQACKKHDFDVAVIGQATPADEKRRVMALIRGYCPKIKVLELDSHPMMKILNDAEDWLEVPARPLELVERVSALAAKRRSRGQSGAMG